MLIPVYTFDELDRTYFELLRREVVAQGLLPDIRTMATKAEYTAAKDTLRTALGLDSKELVEIFGVGSSAAQGEKTKSKIVIRRRATDSGNTGGGQIEYVPYTVDGVQKFKKFQYPDMTKDVTYEIRSIGGSREMEVIMTNIIYKVFGSRRYITTLAEDGNFGDKSFLSVYNGDMDMSMKDQEFVERLFRFTAPDIFVDELTLISDTIVPLTTVSWTIKATASNKEFIEENVNGEVEGEVTGVIE